MPTVAENPLPRLRPVADIQSCILCPDRESAFEFQRALMIAEIRRLEEELARLTRAVQRDGEHYERRATNGKGHSYSGDDGAKSISELRETRRKP